jgi:nuclear pore complex protein Nup54
MFGGSATQNQSTGVFGIVNAPSGSLFSTGAQPVSSFGVGGSVSAQPQTTQSTNLSSGDALINALSNVQIYNDERDLIIAKWNQVQAYYGTGKIFYMNLAEEIKEDNRLNRFKVRL